MFINNLPINNNELPDVFAEFFMQKTAKIVAETKIYDEVYNEKRKL